MDRAKLKEMIEKLNECGVLEKKLKLDAKSKTSDLASAFIKAVATVPDEIESQIPDDVILFYNDAVVEAKTEVVDEPKKEDKVKAPAKPAPKAARTAVKAPAKKAAAKVLAKPAPKEKLAKTARAESNAAKIEAMLAKGGKTLEQMTEITGGKLSSTRNKIQDMKKKGINVVNRDGKFYIED